MEQFEEFATKHGITMRATRIMSRPDWEISETTPEPVHFHIILNIGNRTLWSGEYSTGIGNAENWAKKNKAKFFGDRVGQGGHGWPMREALEQGPGRGKVFRVDSNYWENIRKRFAHAVEIQGGDTGGKAVFDGSEYRARRHPVVLPVADILLSLQLDQMGSDQDFADWAADLGYSDDSMKAHKIWESCNETRRALKRGLGDAFEEFEALEE